MQPWIEPGMWQRATEPDPEATTVSAVVVDADLGSIAVARTPGGYEVFGADSPAGRSGGG